MDEPTFEKVLILTHEHKHLYHKKVDWMLATFLGL